MIRAKILADSLSPQGNRLTTMEVTMPRIILAEFNTHRMFSRNSASSRAIPFKKMVEAVENNPFIPIAWQKDHKGMQGTEYIEDREEIVVRRGKWVVASINAIKTATELKELDVTKQLCNRLLEPFMYHTVLVTASEWENFFELRCPKYAYHDRSGRTFYYKSQKDWLNAYSWNRVDSEGNNFGASIQSPPTNDLEWLSINNSQAEIHIQAAAEAMWDAMSKSIPKDLKEGEWHIPFGDNIDVENLMFTLAGKELVSRETLKVKIATARCARVSYTVVGEEDKPANYENDIKLHDMLAKSGHWSPFEHCARVMSEEEWINNINGEQDFKTTGVTDDIMGWCRNFRGFIQYRSLIDNNR